jgi:MFS transporter, DHA1 family, multidrug resistance protein
MTEPAAVRAAVPLPRQGVLALVLGALTAFGPLSIDMYLPGLPLIQRELRTSAAATELTLSTFFAGLALAQLAYGPLSDRFGRKRPVYAGLLIYALASLGCALAPGIGVLIICRFLQAVGGAAGMVVARAVVRDLHGGREAARLMSLLMLVMGAAPILAPILGSWLVGSAGWRAIFWLLTALGLSALALVALLLPETAPRTVAQPVHGSFAARYLRLLREGPFMAFTLAGGLASAGMFAYIAGSPFVLMDLHHVSPRGYSLIFGSNAVGLILASQVNRAVLARFTPARVLGTMLTVICLAGLALVAVALTPGAPLWALLVPLFVFVASIGFTGPNAVALALEQQAHQAGLASALLGSLQFTAAAASSALVGAGHGRLLPMALVMAGCALGAAGACFLATRARAHPPARTAPETRG